MRLTRSLIAGMVTLLGTTEGCNDKDDIYCDVDVPCPPGMVCYIPTHTCVSKDASVTADATAQTDAATVVFDAAMASDLRTDGAVTSDAGSDLGSDDLGSDDLGSDATTQPIDLPLGASCQGDGQCTSGFCVDQVCCFERCDDPCKRCDQTQQLGQCALVEPGTDPDGDCSGENELCAGSCDAAGACVYPDDNTPCSATECSDGVETSWACNGSGACESSARNCPTCQICGTEGACVNAPMGPAPEGQCPGDTACNSGVCDGNGACYYAPPGVSCDPYYACDGDLVLEWMCTLDHRCEPTVVPCGLYACNPQTTRCSEAPCTWDPLGSHCVAAASCVPLDGTTQCVVK